MTLTKRQKEVLDFLVGFGNKHGYSPSFEEIARALRLTSLATVHKHISTLERKGFLRRTQRGADRRKYHLFLTRHGRELEAELLPIGAAINRRALTGIDPQDAGLAVLLLEKVIANLEAQ